MSMYSLTKDLTAGRNWIHLAGVPTQYAGYSSMRKKLTETGSITTKCSVAEGHPLSLWKVSARVNDSGSLYSYICCLFSRYNALHNKLPDSSTALSSGKDSIHLLSLTREKDLHSGTCISQHQFLDAFSVYWLEFLCSSPRTAHSVEHYSWLKD